MGASSSECPYGVMTLFISRWIVNVTPEDMFPAYLNSHALLLTLSLFPLSSIDCIEEIDVTPVTSPIGLWTAAQKPIVLDLGSAILEISGACQENGHEAEPWAVQGRLLWLRGLDLEDIGQSTCQSGRSHALMHTLLYRHI